MCAIIITKFWVVSLLYLTCIILPGSWSSDINSAGTGSVSVGCDSHKISHSVQSCVPQYLADIWQGKQSLTLGRRRVTSQLSRDKLCKFVDEATECLSNIFRDCNIPQAEIDQTIGRLLPRLPPLSAMCDGTRFCSSAGFKACMQLLPADIATAKDESYLELCPRLRVAKACFEFFVGCHGTFKFKSDVLNANHEWKSENNVGNDAYFSCGDGVPPSGFQGIETVINNKTIEKTVNFHCETAAISGVRCKMTLNWLSKNSGGFNPQSSCMNCNGDKHSQGECQAGNFFNFSSSSCQECPQGSQQINGHLCEMSQAGSDRINGESGSMEIGGESGSIGNDGASPKKSSGENSGIGKNNKNGSGTTISMHVMYLLVMMSVMWTVVSTHI